LSTAISAQDVKALRDRTGAGIMDAKSALQESGGDVDKAIEILRVAAANPRYVSADDVPEADREGELRVLREQAAAEGKPENVQERIVEGRLNKWLEEVVLLSQTHINEEKHGGKTLEAMRAELASNTGENVVIRRFARFQVGEE
jgi:elongation factor Ts